MSLPFSTTGTISITLLVITMPLFIFAVSLLGNAIERAKEEKTKAKEQQRKDAEVKITDIENKIKEAKKTRDTTGLLAELEELKRKKEQSKTQLKRIQKKYSLLEFKKCVLYPGGFFILAIILNELAQIYFKVSTVFWIGSIFAIVNGGYRLCQCLILAQEVAITSEEFQTKKLVEAFREALSLHEKAKLIELYLKFRGITFPYTCKKNTKIKLDFQVGIKKGAIARKTEVWFYVPDGFGLISPAEANSWPQSEDFVVPKIRTVCKELGDISKGIAIPESIIIMSPNISGDYLLMYKLYAEGYSGDREQVKIVVTD